jgi:hypothetical protein
VPSRSEAYQLARHDSERALGQGRRSTETLENIRAQLRRELKVYRGELAEAQAKVDATIGRLDAIAAELASRTEVE